MTKAFADVHARLNAAEPGPHLSRHLYGHFAEHLGRCIYEGVWVGEDSPIANRRGMRNDVLHALKEIRVPVLRWPGGCFADEYHWQDGVGPRSGRPRRINSHWGGVIENNHFGTHEFMALVEELGADAYIAGNMGSGSPREMQEWVEYLTAPHDSTLAARRRSNGRDEPFSVPYFGVGNENWGCGGNMRPEYYADLYRHFATYVKNYNPKQRIQRVACGPNGADFEWTSVLMSRAAGMLDAIGMHYYTLPTGDWSHKGASLGFDEAAWFSTLKNTLRMDELIAAHATIMDRHDPERRVGLFVDEWGTWYDALPGTNPGFLEQQNTLRDAMVAALNLHIFHKHARRVRMANLAQTVNVLQALILTNGASMLRTPTYWVFEMFKSHQAGTSLALEYTAPPYTFGDAEIGGLSGSASRDESGRVTLSLVNPHPSRTLAITCDVEAVSFSKVRCRTLGAERIDSCNTFAAPDCVVPRAADASLVSGKLRLELAPKSIAVCELG
ncbi:MAG: alpha-N-arabinofuranosidase [Myxococcota bacterium]